MANEHTNPHVLLAEKLRQGETLDELVKQGHSHDAVITAVRFRAHEDDKEKQRRLPPHGLTAAAEWAEHCAWLLNGEPVYGAFEELILPAYAALLVRDEAAYRTAMDTVFKAILLTVKDRLAQAPPVSVPAVLPRPQLKGKARLNALLQMDPLR